MTLGEIIWAQSISKVERHKLDEPTVIKLGKVIIAAIDASERAADRHHLVIKHDDLYYLRAILRNVGTVRDLARDQAEMFGQASIASEAEAIKANHDWLKCFIARFEE